jgi:hypothetical protein
MSVLYEFLDKDGNVTHEDEGYCRETLSRHYLININKDVAAVRVYGYNMEEYPAEVTEDNDSDDGDYDEEEEREADGYDFLAADQAKWAPSEVKKINDIFKLLLRKQDITVEMKDDHWVYFSELPSAPLFSLILYFIREKKEGLMDIQKPTIKKLIEYILITDSNTMGYRSTLLTAFYVNTMDTKRTLKYSDYSEYNGPANYMETRILTKPEARDGFLAFLKDNLEAFIKFHRSMNGGSMWRYFNSTDSGYRLDNLIWEALPNDLKRPKDGGSW